MRYQSENLGGEFVFRSKRHFKWEIDMHLHEYSEILYCKEGACSVYVNGANFTLAKGEFIWVPSNYIHMYKSKDAELVCAVFTNDYVPLYNKITGGKKLKVTPVSASGIEEILEGFTSLDYDDLLKLSGYLTLVCSRVFENAVLEEAKQIDETLYQKVIFYISTHYTEDITLSEIAKRFGYNEKYLSHALHELTGTHFRKLLTLYRINKAKEMLSAKGGVNISAIALSCGFSALNTFHRAFKESVGVTPTQYKRGAFSSHTH